MGPPPLAVGPPTPESVPVSGFSSLFGELPLIGPIVEELFGGFLGGLPLVGGLIGGPEGGNDAAGGFGGLGDVVGGIPIIGGLLDGGFL